MGLDQITEMKRDFDEDSVSQFSDLTSINKLHQLFPKMPNDEKMSSGLFSSNQLNQFSDMYFNLGATPSHKVPATLEVPTMKFDVNKHASNKQLLVHHFHP